MQELDNIAQALAGIRGLRTRLCAANAPDEVSAVSRVPCRQIWLAGAQDVTKSELERLVDELLAISTELLRLQADMATHSKASHVIAGQVSASRSPARAGVTAAAVAAQFHRAAGLCEALDSHLGEASEAAQHFARRVLSTGGTAPPTPGSGAVGAALPIAGDVTRPGLRQQQRLGGADLMPTGRRDGTYGRELLRGPDGFDHFIGDRLGTRRDERGRIRDSSTRSFVSDDNRPATPDLQAPARAALHTRRVYEPDGPGPADTAVRKAVQDRQDIERQRGELWKEHLAPIAETLGGHGIRVDAAACGKDNLDVLIEVARPHLSRTQRADLRLFGGELAKLTDRLRTASERLGTAGGALLTAREFPGGRILSEGGSGRGTPHNLDRIVLLLDANGTLAAIEEKGAGGQLGSRWVDNPADHQGPKIRAEQGSPEYLRHMLHHDNKLSGILRAQPGLRASIQAVINGAERGTLRYLLAHTAVSGRVTAIDFVIDDQRLGRNTIRLAGSGDNPEDR